MRSLTSYVVDVGYDHSISSKVVDVACVLSLKWIEDYPNSCLV